MQTRSRLSLCAGALALIALSSPPSSACRNSVQLRLDHETARVNDAELLVQRGGPRAGYANALRVKKRIERHARRRSRGSGASARHLLRRIDRVLAIAMVRADGAIERHSGRALRGMKTAVTRSANVRWALASLQRRLRRSPRSTRLRAHVAEAFARLPEHHVRALAELEKLKRRDLLPDAWAHVALARLYQRRGQSALRDAALASCRKAAGSAHKAVCPKVANIARVPTS